MRLGSVLSEALRNIGSGVSRAFAMFLAVLLSGTLLGGYEAMTVIDLESQAVQRINAYADVNAIVGGTVDGTACDRLSDAGDGMTGTLAGAMRAGEQVVPLATPGKDISSYDVTPGMIRLIAGNAKADVSGVWVPRDVAKDFGLAVGSALRTREGTTRVAGVFDWPNDGRDTRFAYAFIVPVSASASTFNECWVKRLACWLVCLVCAGVGWSMRVRCIRGSRRVRSCWVLVWRPVFGPGWLRLLRVRCCWRMRCG